MNKTQNDDGLSLYFKTSFQDSDEIVTWSEISFRPDICEGEGRWLLSIQTQPDTVPWVNDKEITVQDRHYPDTPGQRWKPVPPKCRGWVRWP